MTREELTELAEEWVKRSKGRTRVGWGMVLESVYLDAKTYTHDTGPELVEMIRYLGDESRNPNTRAKFRRVWLVVKRAIERKVA